MTDFEALKLRYPHAISGTASLQCGDGWLPIIDGFLQEISTITPGSVTITGFYEKYGSLRVDYETSGMSTADSLIFDKAEIVAESRSYRFCETCGQPGHLREDVRTLFVACEGHSRGCDALPPDEGESGIGGKRYRYDEAEDALVEIV